MPRHFRSRYDLSRRGDGRHAHTSFMRRRGPEVWALSGGQPGSESDFQRDWYFEMFWDTGFRGPPDFSGARGGREDAEKRALDPPAGIQNRLGARSRREFG